MGYIIPSLLTSVKFLLLGKYSWGYTHECLLTIEKELVKQWSKDGSKIQLGGLMLLLGLISLVN